MSLRRVRPYPPATLEAMTTDRLHAYRRKLLSLQEEPDLQDITDDEVEEARNPAFLFFKNDPAWREQLRVLLEILHRRVPVRPVNDDLLRCRVCGLLHDDPPWGADGRTPDFDYCDCCGVEFGYQDASPVGARRFRQKWLDRGAPWDSPEARPADWDLEEQVLHIPSAFR